MDKMTKIDGKYYDLSKFNHPGGDVALSHTFGRDSTILFKSYHQFTSNKSLLSIIKNCQFDTICHEHLEYYSSKIIIELTKN